MRCADVAMYLAKESGGGYVFYLPERDSYSRDRLALMADLHRAIECNQLFLVYQPKLNIQTGTIIGLEALARWQHPELGTDSSGPILSCLRNVAGLSSLSLCGD